MSECSDCHRPSPAGAEFCHYCGRKLPSERQVADSVGEASLVSVPEKAAYSFWWPSTEMGHMWMVLALLAVGVLSCVTSCWDRGIDSLTDLGNMTERDAAAAMSKAFWNVIGWYFVINIGRLVYYFATGSETARASKATRNEKAELESLQRKLAIKELKEKLGPDGDVGVDGGAI